MSVRSVRPRSTAPADVRDVERYAVITTSGLNFRSYWQLCRWYAQLIAAIIGGAVALTALALAVMPPSYRATAIVMVDPRQPRITNFEAVIGGMGADALAIESQIDVIESPALAKRVIAELNLGADAEFASPSLLGRLTGANVRETPAQDSRLVAVFKRNLSVRRRGLSYIIEISYSSRDPVKAARIANAVADAYLEDLRSARAEVTARASEWLAARIDELRGRVRESERAVATYKSQHGLVDVTQGNKLINRQIEDLTQQLALSRTRSAEARARLERAQQAARNATDPATLAEALQSPVIATLRGQYADIARIEAEYTALYGSRHPSLVAIKAQRADLKRQIDSEIERILAGVRNDFQVASGREASLEGELTKLKAQAEAMNEADVRLGELQRDAQANRALIEQLLNRAKETKEQQSLHIAEARVISPALTPSQPSRQALLLLIAGGIAGVIVAAAAVLLLEQMRRGFRNPEEVERALSLETIGLLPNTATPWSSRPLLRAASTGQRTLDLNQLLGNPGRSYVAGLRSIQARLRHRSAGGDVLTVLSAVPGEGKSQVAFDLAQICAAVGMRTLLIDADVYGAIMDRRNVLQDASLKQDPVTGLSMIDAANAPARAWDLGERRPEAVANLLERHRRHFDIVLVDAPAILSADSDMRALAVADRALLVVAWDETDRRDVVQAIHALGADARKIDGVVLNKVSARWLTLTARSPEVSRPDEVMVLAPIRSPASSFKARAWRL